jgi:hypothetical protein
MPICPRCGKSLSSEQALTYHLNRKYRCGVWNCIKCKTNFNTKFDLQIHEMKCIGDRRIESNKKFNYPSTETLFEIYKMIPYAILEIDDVTQHIITASPKTNDILGSSPESLLGCNVNDIDMAHKQIQKIENNILIISQ